MERASSLVPRPTKSAPQSSFVSGMAGFVVPRSPHWERSGACHWLAGTRQPCRPCLMHKSGRRASGGLGLGLGACGMEGLWAVALSLTRAAVVALSPCERRGPGNWSRQGPTGGAAASAPKISHSDGSSKKNIDKLRHFPQKTCQSPNCLSADHLTGTPAEVRSRLED